MPAEAGCFLFAGKNEIHILGLVFRKELRQLGKFHKLRDFLHLYDVEHVCCPGLPDGQYLVSDFLSHAQSSSTKWQLSSP